MRYEKVTDKRTLRNLESLGYISEPKYDFYPRVDEICSKFVVNNVEYRAIYNDGNFYPLLYCKEAQYKRPAKR